MAQKTVEYTLGRNPEMGVDGRPVMGPLAPIDLPEPDIESENMLVNFGPQHPATHGVLRLNLELVGETIRRVKPIIGYLHTGMEKTAETLTFAQGSTNVTRMDYLAPLHNELAFSLAVEQLLEVDIPERATTIRILMTEMNRLVRSSPYRVRSV